jgi:hypothetical protein
MNIGNVSAGILLFKYKVIHKYTKHTSLLYTLVHQHSTPFWIADLGNMALYPPKLKETVEGIPLPRQLN